MVNDSLILEHFVQALVEEDICPRCLGELDTGWECNACDYDASIHVVRRTTTEPKE